MLRATLFWRLKKCGFQYDSPRPSTAFHGSSMLWNLLNLFNTSKLNINSGTSHIEVSLKGAKLNTCTFEHCVGDRSLRWFFQTRLLQPSHFRALQAQARIRFIFITHTHTQKHAARTKLPCILNPSNLTTRYSQWNAKRSLSCGPMQNSVTPLQPSTIQPKKETGFHTFHGACSRVP